MSGKRSGKEKWIGWKKGVGGGNQGQLFSNNYSSPQIGKYEEKVTTSRLISTYR